MVHEILSSASPLVFFPGNASLSSYILTTFQHTAWLKILLYKEIVILTTPAVL